MNLREYQRALVHASFALEPSDAAFEALGDVTRFRLYRTMIRARLEGMARVAYRATHRVMGDAAFSASFARFLAHTPPKSPLIRDVIASFAEHARADEALLAEAPSFVPDLLAFEQAKWCVAYVPARMPKVGEGDVRELDFDGVPVLNPTLRRLKLGHAVHELGEDGCAARATGLLVYRPPTSDDVRWYAADALSFSVLERASTAPAPLAVLVRAAAEQLGRALDEALLESLASSLTFALERGVLVGSRG